MKPTIGIIGLGYVGLPLALALAEKYTVLGYDTNKERVASLQAGIDNTLEIPTEEMQAVSMDYFDQPDTLKECNIYIVTVPTPLKDDNLPDFSYLESASLTVAKILAKGDIVIYESTVYPGATEEICLPLLESSSLKVDVDFSIGYSPERINVGDPHNTFKTIPKIVSASNQEALEILHKLYQSVLSAEVYKATSIKVAEAAKVIENTQRDLNIALINELSMIFSRMGIDTEEVLQAAGTKWNFLPFRPGLVGGHCIGVDPYYLTHKAQAIGYHPEIILSGRRINDGMGRHVASELVKAMLNRCIQVNGARVLVMGLTFKENCPDLRNTRVVDVVTELQEYNIKVDVHDPWINPAESEHEYGLTPVAKPEQGAYDAILLAVGHNQFKAMGARDIRGYGKPEHILYDLKYTLPKEEVDLRL